MSCKLLKFVRILGAIRMGAGMVTVAGALNAWIPRLDPWGSERPPIGQRSA